MKYYILEGNMKPDIPQGPEFRFGGGKNARLTVSNDYAAGEGVDYRRFFDRFYREDESHNSKKSGFGIGLSIAQEIARRLGTRIQVSYKNKIISFSISFR